MKARRKAMREKRDKIKSCWKLIRSLLWTWRTLSIELFRQGQFQICYYSQFCCRGKAYDSRLRLSWIIRMDNSTFPGNDQQPTRAYRTLAVTILDSPPAVNNLADAMLAEAMEHNLTCWSSVNKSCQNPSALKIYQVSVGSWGCPLAPGPPWTLNTLLSKCEAIWSTTCASPYATSVWLLPG